MATRTGARGGRGTPGSYNLRPIHGVSVSAGYAHSCALDASGQTWCWGFGIRSVLGNGSNETMPLATPVQQGGVSFTRLYTSFMDNCALDTQGRSQCWGSDFAATPAPPYVNVPATAFTSLAMDRNSLCGVDTLGNAYCWGTFFGQYPADGGQIPAPGPVSQVAISAGHICMLVLGAVYCGGHNEVGQVGDSTQVPKNGYPRAKIPAGVTIVQIAVAGASSCALSSTGQAYCWGENTNGQLGVVGPYAVTTPQPVQQPAGVAFTSLRMTYVNPPAETTICATTAAGQAYCWGTNGYGQVGDGTTTRRTVPTAVHQPPGILFSAVVPADRHTCALEMGTGQPFCWGSGESGELGDGKSTSSLTPVVAGR